MTQMVIDWRDAPAARDYYTQWWCPACKAAPSEPCRTRGRVANDGDVIGAGWIHGMRAQCRMGEMDPPKPFDLRGPVVSCH